MIIGLIMDNLQSLCRMKPLLCIIQKNNIIGKSVETGYTVKGYVQSTNVEEALWLPNKKGID